MKEEDRDPVAPPPDTTHGRKRAGVVFRAPVHSDEELERQAIEQATAARRRSERGAGAGGPSSPPCGDPACGLCQGFVEENIIAPSAPYQVRKIVVPKGRKMLDAPGKRSRARTASVRGRYVRSGPWKKGREASVDATLFTAVANGHVERSTGRIRVAVEDLRGKRRERKVGNLILVLLDASAP